MRLSPFCLCKSIQGNWITSALSRCLYYNTADKHDSRNDRHRLLRIARGVLKWIKQRSKCVTETQTDTTELAFSHYWIFKGGIHIIWP